MLGWISTLCFTLCVLPLAYDGLRGRSQPMNKWFVGAWLGGEVFGLWYTWERRDWPLVVNYIANLTGLALWWRGL